MAREISTEDAKIEQLPPVNLDSLGVNNRPDTIVKAERPYPQEYYDDLKFAEDPITIMISPSGLGRDGSVEWSQAWNNGRPAEVLNKDGKWIQMSRYGFIPANVRITLKRKIVETLLRSRITKYITPHYNDYHESGMHNEAIPSTQMVSPIQILNDPGGARGQQWYEQVMTRNY